ncbi:MAG: RNA methyltransferase [Elusimicrobiota bacterium]|jgi:tRNA G18 (ribose-2'-O)-methylase SpoU|nr:RNA methyltransferase [Elusimicrobiota bacterium]
MKKQIILEGYKEIFEILEIIKSNKNIPDIEIKKILWHKKVKSKEIDFQNFLKIQKLTEKLKTKIIFQEISNAEFKKLKKTVHSKGIFAVLEIDIFDDIKSFIDSNSLKDINIILVLDQIQDPGNFGTIIRTANFFGVDLLLTTIGSVSIQNPKVLRATKGYFGNLRIIQNIDLKFLLEKITRNNIFNVFIADIDKNSKNIFDNSVKFDQNKNMCLIFGSEGCGISKINDKENILKDFQKIKIEIEKNKLNSQSLNLAISVGIILFEVKRQWN